VVRRKPRPRVPAETVAVGVLAGWSPNKYVRAIQGEIAAAVRKAFDSRESGCPPTCWMRWTCCRNESGGMAQVPSPGSSSSGSSDWYGASPGGGGSSARPVKGNGNGVWGSVKAPPRQRDVMFE
jgi:hypothetical protein